MQIATVTCLSLDSYIEQSIEDQRRRMSLNGASNSEIDAVVHDHILPNLTTWKADQLHRFAAFIDDEPDAPSIARH